MLKVTITEEKKHSSRKSPKSYDRKSSQFSTFSFNPPSTNVSTGRFISAGSLTTSKSKASDRLTKNDFERIQKIAESRLTEEKKKRKKRILAIAIIHVVVISIVIAIILTVVFVYKKLEKNGNDATTNVTTGKYYGYNFCHLQYCTSFLF